MKLKLTTAPTKKKEWSKDGKDFWIVAADLEDAEGKTYEGAEWFVPAGSPLPAAGEFLEGEVNHGQYGWRFKKVGGGGGYRGGGARGSDSGSIEAQVAAKIAAELVIADKAELGSFSELTAKVAKSIREAKA